MNDMEDVIRLDTVEQYNNLYGIETLHPLVTVANFGEVTRFPARFTVNYGLYALYLKDTKCGNIQYGRQKYDYEEGTVVSFAPGQVAKVERNPDVRPAGYGLLFHPDLIKGTPLGKEIRQYSFFAYSSSEALHLSLAEREVFMDCLGNIQAELLRPIDRHSRRLISRNIELLLDYCMRFYERQFISRAESNRDVLTRFEALLDEYFRNELPESQGLPSVKYFAGKVCLSPNYFGDLVKKETGRSPQEYIQDKIIDLAKEKILGTEESINEIAYGLGFQYSQHFTRVFKRNVGVTPSEYRRAPR